jgi:hypothetical protein
MRCQLVREDGERNSSDSGVRCSAACSAQLAKAQSMRNDSFMIPGELAAVGVDALKPALLVAVGAWWGETLSSPLLSVARQTE